MHEKYERPEALRAPIFPKKSQPLNKLLKLYPKAMIRINSHKGMIKSSIPRNMRR